MKNILIAILLVFTGYLVVSCNKGGTPEGLTGNAYMVQATLTSQMVFPPIINDTSNAALTGLYDEDANILTFTINYRKDTIKIKQDTLTSIRFFKDVASANSGSAAKVLPISIAIAVANKTSVSGSITRGIAGNLSFSLDEKASFITNSWYVIMFSSKFPNGVLGGQISLVKK